MKKVAVGILVIGVVSLLAGFISRFMVMRLPLAPEGITCTAFLSFAQTCFLLSIALLVVKMAK